MRTFLLAVCSLLVAMGAVEVALRATHAFNARVSWTEPDPWIGYRFTPGREYWFFKENDHAITGRINAMGWRDRERAIAKPAGARRVAVLGDSFVEAFQVESDSTFLSIAERELNRRGRGYEVMNFGRSGLGGAEERLVLEHDIVACVPDVVVLLFTPGNDVADANPTTASNLLRPFYVVGGNDSLILDASFRHSKGYRVRERLNPFKQKSALVSLVAERYNAWRGSASYPADGNASGASGPYATLSREQGLMTAHADSTHLANYALAKRLVVEMARSCAARGIAFVVMSVPLVYEDDVVARLRSTDPTFEPAFFDRDLAALADTTGFAVVPLTEAFAAVHRDTGQRLHWAHWNYAGHRLVGKVLAGALTAPSTPAPAVDNR